MKFTKLALAMAGMFASAHAFAAAVTPTDLQAAGVQEAWVSGASAPSFPIYDGFVSGCDAGTAAIFTNASATGTAVKPGSIGNFTAYACKRGGVTSILYHTVAGGSLFAYTPHTLGLSNVNGFVNRLKNLKVPANYSATVCFQPAGALGLFGTVPVYKACALTAATNVSLAPLTDNTTTPTVVATAPTKPVGGFSDVEAAAFGALAGNVNPALESQAFIGQTFGVAVSTNLYRAMQANQGMSAAAIAADTTFDPALAPNITSAQYTSIITQGGGYQTDWSQVFPANGANPAVSGRIVLARRVETSGTQASSNMFFLKNPCATLFNAGNYTPAVAGDSVLPLGSGFEVFEGSGTGNVKTKLSIGASGLPDNPGTVPVDPVAPYFAIGVVSAENDWRTEATPANTFAGLSAASNGYRFVKVDGNHPETNSVQGTNANGSTFYTARVNSISGAYPFHMEMRAYNTATTANGNTLAGVIPSIISFLGTPSAGPADCQATPRGITINPLGGTTCAPTDNVVTVGVKAGGNNCSPYQLF